MIKCWIDEGTLKEFEIDGSISDLTAEIMALMDAIEMVINEDEGELAGYIFKSFLKMCINTMMHDGEELPSSTKEEVDKAIKRMKQRHEEAEAKGGKRILC